MRKSGGEGCGEKPQGPEHLEMGSRGEGGADDSKVSGSSRADGLMNLFVSMVLNIQYRLVKTIPWLFELKYEKPKRALKSVCEKSATPTPAHMYEVLFHEGGRRCSVQLATVRAAIL